MNPVDFPQVNAQIAENQEEYHTLPSFTSKVETISCWKLTWFERLKVFLFGRLWLRQMNFGQPLQSQLPQIECPFEKV